MYAKEQNMKKYNEQQEKQEILTAVANVKPYPFQMDGKDGIRLADMEKHHRMVLKKIRTIKKLYGKLRIAELQYSFAQDSLARML
jgi:hypothetical protein